MQCPSCGVISENDEYCTDCDADAVESHDLDEAFSLELDESSLNAVEPQKTRAKSTLIEFPGVSRSALPEWRKELSERVREVQERRAREAASELAEAEQSPLTATSSPQPQLELLPPSEAPTINPLVAAALKRIERAHQGSVVETRHVRASVATAVAYAPAREENEPRHASLVSPKAQLSFEPEFTGEISEPIELPRERSLGLVVVPDPVPEPIKQEPPPVPKRIIADDLNDPALNYLDSIARDICVDELVHNRASAFKRMVCALFDIVICGLLIAPIAAAVWFAGNNLRDTKTLIILGGCTVVMAFVYLTLTTALTGRTWAMRLFSLRVIDIKTGLIPTGGQSIGRSFLYLLSLATAGPGILFALISREGYTAHDRVTRTAVITTS